MRARRAAAIHRAPFVHATLITWPEDGLLTARTPSMRTTFSTHKGVRICVLDFSSITSEGEALRAIDEAKTIIRKEPYSSVYTLTDVTGSRVTSAIRNALHEL